MMILRRAVLAALITISGQAWSAPPLSGIEFENFDRSVRAQDDLFHAINGNWVKKTEIPADKSSWGAFAILRERSDERTRLILEDARQGKLKGADARKIGDLYASFMNEAAIEKTGLAPLAGDLARISAIADKSALIDYFALTRREINLGPLTFQVVPDPHDSRSHIVTFSQSGLALPDRDYYLQDDPRFVNARAAYRAYLTTLLRLAGYDKADERAGRVLDLETRLAKIQWDRVADRDPKKTDNPVEQADLATRIGGIDWKRYLASAGLTGAGKVNIEQPSYFTALGKEIDSIDLETWKTYLAAAQLNAYAPYLPHAFADAAFQLYGKTLMGQAEEGPRWKRAVKLANAVLGEAIGKHYVARHFPARNKARMEAMVDHLIKAYGESIDTAEWMTPATRAMARAKLAKYTVKIGYPSVWRDYSSLNIEAGELIGNIKAGQGYAYRRMMAKIGKSVDRQEWLMTPQTVNAYYNPLQNEIVFPAAILQPPFFNVEADDAVNYGGIGSVIGHEISHGFDDQGSRFDGDGNLKDWWTAEDRQRFDALGEKLVAQYGAVEPVPGRKINGKLTLGENIADLSGLQIAYKAWRLSLGGKPSPTIDGLSGDKRFFIGFTQIWRAKIRDAAQLTLLVSDPHSPSYYRPIGAAMNSEAFHEAFDVHPGDRMFKPQNERIRIW
ncbi:M13 family metallopeptidase [Paludibacterium paludis]|uniref:Peptidase M13 n=1 Tax=Paludibacterium paludis TaxID=1225769 RepID=A0A918NWM2_9NEIS|nr:M13 family metallopeptidase [Paludibacterium paludis]GGY02368.1 peptidase M13 [Paludibacterium paludis]